MDIGRATTRFCIDGCLWQWKWLREPTFPRSGNLLNRVNIAVNSRVLIVSCYRPERTSCKVDFYSSNIEPVPRTLRRTSKITPRPRNPLCLSASCPRGPHQQMILVQQLNEYGRQVHRSHTDQDDSQSTRVLRRASSSLGPSCASLGDRTNDCMLGLARGCPVT